MKPEELSLTASELGYLWTGYSINELSKWYLTVFHNQAKDGDVKNLYSFALKITNELLIKRKQILSHEGYSSPIGFSQKDINDYAPALFSDRFLLYYLHEGTRLGLEFHTRALALATGSRVRGYCLDCLNSAVELHERVVELLMIKGLHWQTPTLPPVTSPEMIKKTSYLAGWFGDTRPINSMEIANLYFIIELLIMIETLCAGFAQTTDSQEIEKLFIEAKSVAKNQYEELIAILNKDDLSIPPSYMAELTDTKLRVFSDRLMTSHVAGLYGSLLSQYGFSLGAAMKHDLVATYTEHIGKSGAFSEKVTRVLIEKGWLEKVPGVASR